MNDEHELHVTSMEMSKARETYGMSITPAPEHYPGEDRISRCIRHAASTASDKQIAEGTQLRIARALETLAECAERQDVAWRKRIEREVSDMFTRGVACRVANLIVERWGREWYSIYSIHDVLSWNPKLAAHLTTKAREELLRCGTAKVRRAIRAYPKHVVKHRCGTEKNNSTC